MNETFDNKTKPRPTKKFIKVIFLLISYLIVALIVWKVTTKMQTSPAYQQEQAQKQIDAMIQKVGKLVVLPSDETPQIAVIQDVDALKKTQDFFIDAENGDKILVYVKARKAIIYRESTNKIVNIALNIGTGDTTTQKTTTPPKDTTPATSTSTTTAKAATSTR